MIPKPIAEQRVLLQKATAILDRMERDYGFWQAIDAEYAERKRFQAIRDYSETMTALVRLAWNQAGMQEPVMETEPMSVVEIAEEVYP